jgi:ribosomal protein S10
MSHLISKSINQTISDAITDLIFAELEREFDKVFKTLKACASDGFIQLPTKKRIYCVLGFPHLEKDSREHFEIRVHKGIIEIYYDLEG